jgi:hypothetical protein
MFSLKGGSEALVEQSIQVIGLAWPLFPRLPITSAFPVHHYIADLD